MGCTEPRFPDLDPAEFLRQPLMVRARILTEHWVDNGLPLPAITHPLYILKLVVFYAIGGVVVATETSDLPAFWQVMQWWNEPIVYQKLILWTVLLEAIGVAGSWGPLAGRIKPMVGGIRFWIRPGTIRLRPWKWVPLTNGDRRHWCDVVIYAALLLTVAIALFSPGAHSDSLLAATGRQPSDLVAPALLVPPMVLLVLIGLRDKTIFLAARGEQYLPALFFFTVLGFVDMIVALKLLIVVVWLGAGVSKFGKHFVNVIPPMVSNSPAVPFTWLKRVNYRDFPHDLRPSRAAYFSAHVSAAAEICAPLVLLFSTNRSITVVAVAVMVAFHMFIISSFPLAAPLEWNLLFCFAAAFLFLGFPAWDGYGVTDMSSGWLGAVIIAGLVFFPILGNFRPDKVSFLPSMRQYVGNWASAVWAFTPGTEQKLNKVTRSCENQLDQFIAFGYDPLWAEITLQYGIPWRAMHSQGRGLFSVLLKTLPDIDYRIIREGEFECNSLIGFNFGDGHLHNEDLIAAVQSEAGFEPGELVVVWVEAQAWGSKLQHYKVIDAALGVIERGTWKVADAVAEQPWLPNGPIPTEITWTLSC